METLKALWGFIAAIFTGFGDLIGSILGIPTALVIIILVILVIIGILRK